MLKKTKILILLIPFIICSGCLNRWKRNIVVEYREKPIARLGARLMDLYLPNLVTIALLGVGDSLLDGTLGENIYSTLTGVQAVHIMGVYWQEIEKKVDDIKDIFMKILKSDITIETKKVDIVLDNLILNGYFAYLADKKIPEWLKKDKGIVNLNFFSIDGDKGEVSAEEGVVWKIRKKEYSNSETEWELIQVDCQIEVNIAILNKSGEVIG